MNFSMDTVMDGQLKGEVLTVKAAHGGERTILKVYDMENSTRDYNAHPIIRNTREGYTVIAERPYNLIAGNHYLSVILAWNGRQYVTWFENLECGGCYGGHYFGGDFEKALKDFGERGL